MVKLRYFANAWTQTTDDLGLVPVVGFSDLLALPKLDNKHTFLRSKFTCADALLSQFTDNVDRNILSSHLNDCRARICVFQEQACHRLACLILGCAEVKGQSYSKLSNVSLSTSTVC